MLESVWDYGTAKLVESGENAAVRSRHLDYFLQMAEEAEPSCSGREQLEWIEKLAAEHGNLRMALDWARRRPVGVERGLRLAGALERYWEVRTHLTEGREHCARAAGPARGGGTDHGASEGARRRRTARLLPG